MAKRPALVALLASPRPQGHSAALLSAFLKPLVSWDIMFFQVSSLRLKPCIGCNHCLTTKTHQCFQHDAFPKLINAWDKATAMVLAAPVYFYGFPSQAKAMIDRCHPLFHDSHWIKHARRPGFFLADCGAAQKSEFKAIVPEAKAFMNTLGFDYTGELLVPGMSNRNATTLLHQAQRRAHVLGQTLASQGGDL